MNNEEIMSDYLTLFNFNGNIADLSYEDYKTLSMKEPTYII